MSSAADVLRARQVAVAVAELPWDYPPETPYRPHEEYEELSSNIRPSACRNTTYAAFRELLRGLGFDRESFGTIDWNPLGTIIQPGQRVLVKPNLVRHLHMAGGDLKCVTTHGSVIRCALDYVALALKGDGEIILGDAPVQSADFDAITAQSGLREICGDIAACWRIPVRLVDFRLWSVGLDDRQRIVHGERRQGDASGYCRVDLGKRSLLYDIARGSHRYRVTNYDARTMVQHHNDRINEYLIPRTVLDADVVVNLPKLKTHRKVGLTAALKNSVGINGHKDWLPHHRQGSVSEGGDEYRGSSWLKRVRTCLQEAIDRHPGSRANGLRHFAVRLATRIGRRLWSDQFSEGSWYGNDTLWRTVLDLNRLLLYAGCRGEMANEPQRRCLTIVDGIIAGEGEGPMEPDSRACGLLVGGRNAVAVDAVLATIIGFDYCRIPLIAEAFEVSHWPLVEFRPTDIEIHTADPRFSCIRVGQPCDSLRFRPPAGWLGHIELQAAGTQVDSPQSLSVTGSQK